MLDFVVNVIGELILTAIFRYPIHCLAVLVAVVSLFSDIQTGVITGVVAGFIYGLGWLVIFLVLKLLDLVGLKGDR